MLVDHASRLLLCSSRGCRRQPRQRARQRRRRVGRRRDGGRRDALQPRARDASGPAERARRGARRLPAARPRTARATSTFRRGWRRSSICCGRCRSPSCSRCTRARAPGCATPGCDERLERSERMLVHRAARLHRVERAAVQRARRGDGLRRPPEGGVPCRRAVHHAALEHRVDRDGADADGTRSSTSTATPRWRRSNATPPAERPPLYGDGHAAERCCRRLHCASHEGRTGEPTSAPFASAWSASATGGRTSRATSPRSTAASCVVCDARGGARAARRRVPGRAVHRRPRRAARRSASSTRSCSPRRCRPTPSSPCACSRPASTASWRSRSATVGRRRRSGRSTRPPSAGGS